MSITTSIFKTAITSAGSFFGGIQTYLIVGAVTAALSLGAGAYVGYRWEHGEVLKLQLADAQFVKDQIALKGKNDAAMAAIDLSDATWAQKTFDDQHLHYVTITKEIPAHVTPHQDAVACISVGLARLMRAEADGSDADTLQLAEGQSDDDCSDVTPTEMAGWFKDFAAASNHNASQLNMLEADIKAKHDEQAGLQ